jgi:hypothetical protein
MATRPKFKLWHSVIGLLALAVSQAVALSIWPAAAGALVSACALVGAAITLYVATEAIEEVRGKPYLFAYLAAILAQYIVFFALQYFFLASHDSLAFPTLSLDVVSLTLHSTMIFALNPLYGAEDSAGRLLLLIDTVGSLGLALFVLQNIWQLRR